MAIGVTVKVDNRFDQYERQVDRVLDEVVTQLASAIKVEARRRAPVRTGQLRDSIDQHRVGHLEQEVTAEAPYAIFVELGTTRTAPRPFLGPAARSVVSRIDIEVERALSRID